MNVLRRFVAASVLASLMSVARGQESGDSVLPASSPGLNTATSWNMPFDYSPFQVPPLVIEPSQGVSISFKSDGSIIRQIVPEPLSPDPEHLFIVTANLFEMVKPVKLQLRVTSLMIPTTFRNQLGYYHVRVFEDGRDPTLQTIWGREIWGMPKLAAKQGIHRDNAKVEVNVQPYTRGYMNIQLTLAGERKESEASTLRLYFRKTIPSAENPRMPALDRLIEAPWEASSEWHYPATVKECKVVLDSGAQAIELPVNEVVDAHWYERRTASFGNGRVMLDYLK